MTEECLTDSNTTVYISYVKEDRMYATKLHNSITKAGVKSWIDIEDIKAGEEEKIVRENAIQKCDYFLTLISKNSVKNQNFFHKELKIAIERYDELPENTIFIIPVIIDGTEAKNNKIKNIHCVDISINYEQGLKKILKAFSIEYKMKNDNVNLIETSHIPQTFIVPPKQNVNDTFVGRTDIINNLVETREHYLIYGSRQIGKTWLLKYLENMFSKSGINAFYISIQGTSSSKDFENKVRNSFRRKKSQFLDYLSGNLNTFEKLKEIDDNSEKDIIFLLDEIEAISEFKSEDNKTHFIDEFYNFLNKTNNIRFIITAAPKFKQIINQKYDPKFFKVFKHDILGRMSENEALQLIDRISDNKIEKYQYDQILDYTDCQPFFIEQFVRRLKYTGRIRKISKNIAMETYNSSTFDNILTDYFNGFSDDDKKIINKVFNNKILFESKTKLDLLTQYACIKKKYGKYKISNWFFNEWLQYEKQRHWRDILNEKKYMWSKLVEHFFVKRIYFQSITA